jgi:ATP-binding cassette, subfamily B, multidrug efflux pump
MLKKLIPFFQKYKLAAILCPILVLFEVVADIVMPLLMSKIVDIGIKNQDIAYINRTGLLMIVLAISALVCGVVSTRYAAVASQGAGAELRSGLFSKIQSFSFADMDKFSVPSLITRMTTDINNLQQSAMMGLRMLIRAPFMMILALIMALIINRELALVFVVAIPVLAVGLALVMSKAHPRFLALQRKFDGLNTSIQENLISIKVVKSFVRTDYEKTKFKKSNDDLMKAAIHAVKLVIINQPLMQLVMYACIIAILYFGGGMVTVGKLQTGQLISFITYVSQILMSLMILSMLFLMFTRGKASGERVLEVLDTHPSITDPIDAVHKVSDGSVEFRNVGFGYAGDSRISTLSHINLLIQPGEIIGIIGATGSGKTSLVQLIPRLYDVTEGAVLVGGQDVRRYSLEALRNAVAMVLQKNTLFSGTIRENLQWGKGSASDEEMQQACEAAEAWKFVRELPNGLDTDLSQGGVNLSGGQKQRLCIARALLKRPKIIILDDSTSAVDMTTDARIRQMFKTKLQGVTTLIIAQRVCSIEHADRIIVLDDGKINAVGTHNELLKSNEIYQDVYNAQQEGAIAG